MKLKSASELKDGEISPCQAVNAQNTMYRAQEAMNSKGRNNIDATLFRAFREAESNASSASTGCRRCNPYLQVCFNATCSIPSPAIEKQKGYTG